MPTPQSDFVLNNGTKIPSVIYGSYNAKGDDGVDAMVFALDKANYRGIDTALFYNNHESVAKALKRTKVPRDQIFLQTKIWPTQMRDPEKWLDVCIEELGTYIDCFMIHWPIVLKPEGDRVIDTEWDFIKTWKLMEKLPKEKCRSIGVCNFTKKQLQQLLDATDVVPVINQCEFHPELPQQKLVDFCQEHKILPQAYRPMAKGQIFNDTIKGIAEKHKCDPGQVCLSWNVIRGVDVMPKSATESRIISNRALISLDESDMEKIGLLGAKNYRSVSAVKPTGVDYFDEE
ncbi:aldo-keto reductase superfamily protein [Starmerella bacillaris]|uniref:Aldo-keto reductase superfamily protein n=1 Tax=Starmerella bacillaris TaxID=1247836 RepID=A0AAV5RG40_STABA|nr:aldo-keto reductase superfamily protein [Starmerella bacillaris]